ncbi:hypothetical protein SAMN05216302_101445 [Nitrosomonas aestuarii]|uniref:Prohead serine protease domain-containing protein n=1 Tax=Nitrosomonas aestuarii TaxID=52441 RepID=A0A1I4C0Y6_9PROT|nr:HK97 family phage prohead protease [Nitrosomonas aestuarii]SFK74738.1 hypothetical protein SAMN05216302_101445 [Nitrosomonas aestuarii]
MKIQRLNCSIRELKFAETGTGTGVMEFSGYGSVFGNKDSYGDVIEKGAFSETLQEANKSGQWPSLLLQHGGFGLTADDMMPIGVISELNEDDIGLKMDAILAETEKGRDAYTLMKMKPRPAINGLSIGYIPKEWKVGTNPDEPRRTLKSVELMEISLVTFPANRSARVLDVKSDLDIRSAEQALRDAGFSRSESKQILAHGFKSIGSQREAEDMEALARQIRLNIAAMKK